MSLQYKGHTDTSRKAYIEIANKLGEAQMAVHKVLLQGPHTCQEIARELGKYPSDITGRLSELLEMGMVQQLRKRACKITGKTAYEWVVVRGALRLL